jgi:long-chain acyl-CoA synthetase
MSTPQRLFDCLPILMKDAPNETLLAAKEGGKWKEYSTREVTDIVEKLSAGLLAMGIKPYDMSVEKRDKVAILSKKSS